MGCRIGLFARSTFNNNPNHHYRRRRKRHYRSCEGHGNREASWRRVLAAKDL